MFQSWIAWIYPIMSIISQITYIPPNKYSFWITCMCNKEYVELWDEAIFGRWVPKLEKKKPNCSGDDGMLNQDLPWVCHGESKGYLSGWSVIILVQQIYSLI